MSLMRHGPGDIGDWVNRWMDVPMRLMGQWFPTPAIEIREEKERILAKVDVPGMDPAKLEVTVRPWSLTVQGEAAEEEAGGSSQRFGRFTRTVSLPADVEAERAEAVCRRGILRITMPKKHPEDGGHRLAIREDDD